MDFAAFHWVREPRVWKLAGDTLEITTEPHTDLWQRTYYNFRNDNAPIFQFSTIEKYFSFVCKTDFRTSQHRFDQCGLALYLDEDNWLKCSIEYYTPQQQYLGSVVTNAGYSDWATTAIGGDVKSMWYRLSRRESDYCLEHSADGHTFQQMRICHLIHGNDKINVGVYACSPEESSFRAIFSHIEVLPCQWKTHDGQQPD